MSTLIAITTLGILCLIFEIFDLRKWIVPFTILGLSVILGISMMDDCAVFAGLKAFNDPSKYNNMIVVDKFATAFSGLFILLTIFLVALSSHFYDRQQARISDFVAIKVFLLAGAVAMVSFGNLAMFFLGIEVLSISLYILAASNRLNLKSNEAGMKYFLMGSFASGIILFGICLIYGAMGSFDLNEIKEWSMSAELPMWYPIGIVMVAVGMFFKIAAVPFHFWAPDVYEGSPSITTATMSTLAKVVAVATLFKLLSALNIDGNEFGASFKIIVSVILIASMTVGNIMALKQSNVKRMLAFSGISHAGFMLLTMLCLSASAGNLLYYTFAYSLAGISAFAVLLYVCHHLENEDITNFHGLAKTHPLLAAILTGSLLSMAGIPIFSGFFAKFFLFNQAIAGGYLWLVIIGVINSIISVGYYFKLIIAMYVKESNEYRPAIPPIIYGVAIVSMVLNLIIGFFPSLVLGLLE
jgi:NADH-quinone oxidoreductase subunit N